MNVVCFTTKDTGLSVALLISVVRTPFTKSMVSFTMPCTCKSIKEEKVAKGSCKLNESMNNYSSYRIFVLRVSQHIGLILFALPTDPNTLCVQSCFIRNSYKICYALIFKIISSVLYSR